MNTRALSLRVDSMATLICKRDCWLP